MYKKITMIVTACAFVAGCAAGIKTNSDWNQSTDFTQYKTFAWLPDATTDGSGQAADQLTDQRIRSAIDSALESKGLQKTSASTADMMVGYQVTTKDQVTLQTTGSAWGGGGWRYGGGMAMGTQTTNEYHETVGTLTIVVADTKSKNVVWHGSGEGTLKEGGSPDERAQSINDSVTKILEKFPPQ